MLITVSGSHCTWKLITDCLMECRLDCCKDKNSWWHKYLDLGNQYPKLIELYLQIDCLWKLTH